MQNVCNFSTTLYDFDEGYLSESVCFAQQPLGTVINGKQKIGIFPDKWTVIENNELPKFRKGNFIVYKDSKGKTAHGKEERRNSNCRFLEKTYSCLRF